MPRWNLSRLALESHPLFQREVERIQSCLTTLACHTLDLSWGLQLCLTVEEARASHLEETLPSQRPHLLMDHPSLVCQCSNDQGNTGMFFRKYPRYRPNSRRGMDDATEIDLTKLYQSRRGLITSVLHGGDNKEMVQSVILAVNK